MSKLSIYNFITLNGYFTDPSGNPHWHAHGPEEAKFSEEQVGRGNILVFGRVTYEHMVSYWPTPAAKKDLPVIADGMNRAEKIVFSKTLERATWENTRIMRGGLEDEIRRLKKTSQKDLTVLGSGTIVTQLAEAGLIDEFQIMIDPVALGDGKSMLKGLSKMLKLRLAKSQVFKTGVILAYYEAA